MKAADYAKWRSVLQSNVASGSASLVVAPCYFTPNSPGATFMPFTVNTPITISGTGPETVTPTAVGTPTYVSGVRGGCQVSISVTLSNAHNAGVNVTTGDGGITEAAAAVKKGVVVIDGASGSDTAISSLPIANAFVVLRDDHGAQCSTVLPRCAQHLDADLGWECSDEHGRNRRLVVWRVLHQL